MVYAERVTITELALWLLSCINMDVPVYIVSPPLCCFHLTHHDKVDQGNCIGVDVEYCHGSQHVQNDASHCGQDDNSSPDVQTQEKEGYHEHSTCGTRRGEWGDDMQGGSKGRKEGKEEKREGGQNEGEDRVCI